MKIIQEHYDYMQKEIADYLNGIELIARAKHETGDFPRSESVKDLQRRFCFDVLYFSGLTSWVCENIYHYANDDHLFTALKKICPKVERKF